MKDLEKLAKIIGHDFRDFSCLEVALTHRSANRNHYERMEFLGDSILNFVISNVLYQKFPEATEGQLSRLRAHLVKGDSLSALATKLNLSEYLRLGSGELKSGGFRRKSILADVVESIIGAIYIDSGINAASDFILRLFDEKLSAIDINKNMKDPKTRLQELMQARGLPLPDYEIIATTGKAHNQVFSVSCQVELLEEPVSASGSSRRKAEQAAAETVLQKLEAH